MTWRHLNFFQHQAYLNARVPRVRCGTCGIKTATVPWARPYLIVADHDRRVSCVEGPMTGPGKEPRHRPVIISTGSCAARLAPIATSWPPSIAARNRWPVCRPAAS